MNPNKPRVLIVDDTPESINILLNALKDEFSVVAATNGLKAIERASQLPKPDIILLDVIMTGMDGYQVCKTLKSSDETKDIPIIFVTALGESKDELKGLQLGAVDFITKPITPSLVRSRVHNHLELKRHRDHLQELVDERTLQLKRANESAIEAMGIVAENRDFETGGHIQRTKNFVRILAEKLAEMPKYKDVLTKGMIEHLYFSAPLHDLGKVAISDNILLKPGPLTVEEFEIMKTHTTIGEKTIRITQKRFVDSEFLNIAREIAGSHHEKWNGTGYPRGLKGDEIPLSGRIMALADVYDALISRRTYKEPISHQTVVEMIKQGSGKHFDPEVVAAFLQLENKFKQIAAEFSDYKSDEITR